MVIGSNKSYFVYIKLKYYCYIFLSGDSLVNNYYIKILAIIKPLLIYHYKSLILYILKTGVFGIPSPINQRAGH